MSERLPEVGFDRFAAVDIRAGTVVDAEVFPEARRPAYKVRVDFGPEIGTLKTSAQVTGHYRVEDLPGRRVLGVINLGVKQIGPFRSEFLLLGVHGRGGEVHLATVDGDVPDGGRLH